MYYGSMEDIEFALDDGTVTWEGLARNVEYLDIRDDMRQFLGHWYARRCSPPVQSNSSESSDSEEDGIFSPIPDSDTDADCEDEMDADEVDEQCADDKKRFPVADASGLFAISQPRRAEIP